MSIGKLLAALVLAGAAATAQAQACPGIVHEEITVDARNDEWTPAQVKAGTNDLVIVFASGMAKIDPKKDAHGPNGRGDGFGRLEMKIGTGTVVPVGDRWVGAFAQTGAIKFRLHDTKFTDNSGEYRVHLIVIPAKAFPPAIKINTDG
jgi:hypothetical protein